MLSPLQFEEHLKGPLPEAAIYLLHGEEIYWLEGALDQLLLRLGRMDFNFDPFYAGPDLDLERLEQALETLPFMAERRIVLIKQGQNLKEKEMETLLRFIENPVLSTALVMVAESVDFRRKFFKKLQTKGIVVEFKSPSPQQIPELVQRMATRKGKRISPDLAWLIYQMVGAGLIDIWREMEKICDYVGERPDIVQADLEAVVSHSRFENVFDMTEAIGCGDRGKALVGLSRLLEQGQSEIGILSLVSRHIRILMLLQEYRKQRRTAKELAAQVGVPGFFLSRYMTQSEMWGRERIIDTHRLLLETDLAMKSSPVRPSIWLERLLALTSV